MNEPDINRTDQYERLLALPVMTSWTASRQQEHAADAAEYETALAALQAGLRSQHVEGDGRWSAKRRARKVEKHLRNAVKAARQQEKAMESLRTAYADHVHHLAALPAQREEKQKAKELRRSGAREAVAAVTAKSLHKSTAAFATRDDQAPEAAEPTEAPTPAQVRGISDLWQRGA
ncbi:hypothetical protein [Streptomyces sp. NPDC101115]|uniref:hypothetical protein n=1 Tax=Streptomyces sp. NPDC101115 TaxID=3366106 RepID=UPI003803970E